VAWLNNRLRRGIDCFGPGSLGFGQAGNRFSISFNLALSPLGKKKRFRDHWRRLSQSSKPGRPSISKEIRQLIQDMWQSNPTWGSFQG